MNQFKYHVNTVQSFKFILYLVLEKPQCRHFVNLFVYVNAADLSLKWCTSIPVEKFLFRTIYFHIVQSIF